MVKLPQIHLRITMLNLEQIFSIFFIFSQTDKALKFSVLTISLLTTDKVPNDIGRQLTSPPPVLLINYGALDSRSTPANHLRHTGVKSLTSSNPIDDLRTILAA